MMQFISIVTVRIFLLSVKSLIEDWSKRLKRNIFLIMKVKSIKTKVAVYTILFMVILTSVITAAGYKLYRDSVMKSYISYTETVLEYSYRSCVDYSFGDMIKERDMPDDYEKFRSELNTVKDSSDIEYLYAVYFDDINDIHSLHYAINAKSQEELSSGKPLSEIYSYMGKTCEEGAFEDDTLMLLRDAVKNKECESKTLEGYSDDYGHMLNGYRVVFDSDDNAVGLICVEVDINRINSELSDYVRIVIMIALILTAVIISLYYFNIERYLIRPILNIAESSDSFVKEMQNNTEPENLIYNEVSVREGSELGLLANNVKSLADGVALYMTSLKKETSERERISTELSLATQIQAAMLPHDFPPYPERHEFDIFATMEPAKEVGGDFYDFFFIDDDHLCLVMADVSGKGIPAALFMMISKTILQSCAMLGVSAGEILTKTNEAFCSNNQVDMFVTVWLGILEISTGKMTCANAGHEYPAIKRKGGSFELFKDKHGIAIGAMDGVKYKEYTLQFEPGDKLFVYTDGVPEATDADMRMFGTAQMVQALNNAPEADPEKIISNVRSSVQEFVKNAEQFDDLTMLCIEYLGNSLEDQNDIRFNSTLLR
ncbi:MAG: serine/threonine-protein phosphatase [Ruminococcus flavefaciens]|jgi:sigma-B regulation protein RsbU (phosphoserine phosphatase)|nr:serine/threonine-protein phosphatase [Ruminococcus flavefaciens]